MLSLKKSSLPPISDPLHSSCIQLPNASRLTTLVAPIVSIIMEKESSHLMFTALSVLLHTTFQPHLQPELSRAQDSSWTSPWSSPPNSTHTGGVLPLYFHLSKFQDHLTTLLKCWISSELSSGALSWLAILERIFQSLWLGFVTFIALTAFYPPVELPMFSSNFLYQKQSTFLCVLPTPTSPPPPQQLAGSLNTMLKICVVNYILNCGIGWIYWQSRWNHSFILGFHPEVCCFPFSHCSSSRAHPF